MGGRIFKSIKSLSHVDSPGAGTHKPLIPAGIHIYTTLKWGNRENYFLMTEGCYKL